MASDVRPRLDEIEPVQLADLRKRIVVPRYEFELWLEAWDWTYHQLMRNEFPGFASLDEFQLGCICAAAHLWVPAFLREPEDPDHRDPYNLFDYQAESLLYPGNTVHKCGAEVGKTREIVAKGLHKAFTTRNGSALIGAPMQGHLDEIIEAMDDQLTWNPELGNCRWHRRHKDGWKKHPYHAFYFTNGFKIDFRPSGHDGNAYRGVHARTFAIKDEGVKDKNPKQWSEFWRAVKPGCVVGAYSVPDGDRSCDFYKLGQRAVRVERTDPVRVRERLIRTAFSLYRRRIQGERYLSPPPAEEIYGTVQPNREAGDSGTPELSSLKDADSHVKNMRFLLVQWSKTIMPAPYWTDERRAFFRDQFNGEDSAEYKHNVMGEDGEPAYSVFPWEQLRHTVKEIPDYRCLKVLVDAGRGEVRVTGYKCELAAGDSEAVPRAVSLIDTTYPLATFFEREVLETVFVPELGREVGICGDSEFTRLVKRHFVYVPGMKRGGADFGYSGDPTEIVIRSIYGERKRAVARLQLKHVTYDQQCQALDALDTFYGPPETITWGTDLGNAGSAVAHDLQGLPEYRHKRYEDRLKGFQFEGTTDNVDEKGAPILDAKDGKPVKITLKELATDHMVRRIQRMTVEYPPDPDIPFVYPNHTVSHAGKHRMYKKKDDHLIDADRAEYLAEILGGVIGGEDIFE